MAGWLPAASVTSQPTVGVGWCSKFSRLIILQKALCHLMTVRNSAHKYVKLDSCFSKYRYLFTFEINEAIRNNDFWMNESALILCEIEDQAALFFLSVCLCEREWEHVLPALLPGEDAALLLQNNFIFHRMCGCQLLQHNGWLDLQISF